MGIAGAEPFASGHIAAASKVASELWTQAPTYLSSAYLPDPPPSLPTSIPTPSFPPSQFWVRPAGRQPKRSRRAGRQLQRARCSGRQLAAAMARSAGSRKGLAAPAGSRQPKQSSRWHPKRPGRAGRQPAACENETKEKNIIDKSPSICTFLARRKYGERLIY